MKPQSQATLENRRSAFTLVELLVVMSVIAILATASWAALFKAKEAARAARTRTILAKIDVAMRKKYESYNQKRRVQINTAGLTRQQIADARLKAIQDTMRMEMPDATTDVTNGPIAGISRPAISQRYKDLVEGRGGRKPLGTDKQPAKLLCMILTVGNSETQGLFQAGEMDVDPADGWPYFVDGWGRPIMWLRWAPGYSSELQAAGTNSVFQMVPLIYSAGSDGKYGVDTQSGSGFNGDPFANTKLGQPDGSGSSDNLDNHHLQ